jgi:putative glycosyltransferase (TIGR04372 family)
VSNAVRAINFVKRQLDQIQAGGLPTLSRKSRKGLAILLELVFGSVIVIPSIIFIRAIKRWRLIRWEAIISPRIGHLAGNMELYLCERDAGINAPKRPHFDVFFHLQNPISNRQLVAMWKRIVPIWPRWFMRPVRIINGLLPGGNDHEIGPNTQSDRDVHNLLDDTPPHLAFTDEEERKGQEGLRAMGIPPESPFVCLIVRDGAYLDTVMPTIDWSYHSFRDSDIRNYRLAAEELARRGCFVIRMGAVVHTKFDVENPLVIDYATNGMRTDFMDIYLGAKCLFCISVGTGFDGVPYIFRRPIAYVNAVPIGYLATFCRSAILLSKHHVSLSERRELSLREILNHDAGYCLSSKEFEFRGMQVVENTPEEIRDVAVEMFERLTGEWVSDEADLSMERRFRELFPKDARDSSRHQPLHGEIRARFSALYLRDNPWWLD